MTEKQRIFADEYLVDFNATRAYKKAYPKVKKDASASVNGSKLLRNTKVSEYIAERMKERQERLEITQDMVVMELAAVAFSKVTDYAHVVEKNVENIVDGEVVPVYDSEGNPMKYRTVELELTKNLSETQKKALAVMKKGRDGYEVKTYDKLRALELLGRHLGMFGSNTQNDSNDDGVTIINDLS